MSLHPTPVVLAMKILVHLRATWMHDKSRVVKLPENLISQIGQLGNYYSSSIVTPDSRSDPISGSEPVSVCETIYCIYLGLFILFYFFFRAELVPVGIQTISVITKIIYIHKRTTIEVVSIKIYTHILSPIYLYKYYTRTYLIQTSEIVKQC